MSEDDCTMPMLSLSHRTTAPAMATEPWRDTSESDHGTRRVEMTNPEELSPPGRSRQACVFPVCRLSWSGGRDPTPPAGSEQRDVVRTENMADLLDVKCFPGYWIYLGPRVSQQEATSPITLKQETRNELSY